MENSHETLKSEMTAALTKFCQAQSATRGAGASKLDIQAIMAIVMQILALFQKPAPTP